MTYNHCNQIALAYGHFLKEEKAWRLDFEKSKTDLAARRRAHTGMKMVEAALKDIPKFDFCPAEIAQEIMGADLLGAEAVKQTFGFDLEKDEIPAIMFSPKRLEESKKLGAQLILRVAEDRKGGDMTVKRMFSIVAGRMPGGQLIFKEQKKPGSDKLNDDFRYRNNDKFTTESFIGGWVLVFKNPDREKFNWPINFSNSVIEIFMLHDFLQSHGLLTVEEKTEYVGWDREVSRNLQEMGYDWAQRIIFDYKLYEKQAISVSSLLDWMCQTNPLLMEKKHRRNAAARFYDQMIKYMNGFSPKSLIKTRKGNTQDVFGDVFWGDDSFIVRPKNE
jgi:hypothetical protein